MYTECLNYWLDPAHDVLMAVREVAFCLAFQTNVTGVAAQETGRALVNRGRIPVRLHVPRPGVDVHRVIGTCSCAAAAEVVAAGEKRFAFAY